MKTSEKTAEEKTHFYSLLTGAVPRLDFVLHMIKVTQYLADVEHHLEFEKKKPKTSLKLLLVRELIFFFRVSFPTRQILMLSDGSRPDLQSQSISISGAGKPKATVLLSFPTGALKTEKDNFSNPPLRVLARCSTYWSCGKRMPVLNRLKSRWYGGNT